MTYPCHVCASTMLPGVTYTIPREYDPSQPSCGKVYYYYQGSGYPGMVSSPTLVDCGFCKGSGMVGERRMSRGPRRRKADRRAMLSLPEALSAETIAVPRELLSDLCAYGLIRPIENIIYGPGRGHRERIKEALLMLWQQTLPPSPQLSGEPK